MSFPSLHFKQRLCCAVHAFNVFQWMNEKRNFSLAWMFISFLKNFNFNLLHFWMEMSAEDKRKRREGNGECLWFFAYVLGLGLGCEFSSRNSNITGILSESLNIRVSGELTQFKRVCVMQWNVVVSSLSSFLFISLRFDFISSRMTMAP